VQIEAPPDSVLPFGFGMHPYFRVGLGGDRAERCVVTVPVRQYWELVDMIATGRRLPAADRAPLAGGVPFGDTHLDDVFTDLVFDDDRQCRASIDDPESGRRMTLTFDDTFSECVVYNPPHRQAICIEPYTCVPDAARLQSQGIGHGLRRLEPGESFATTLTIAVESM
jgi:aldose 1-epimerase